MYFQTINQDGKTVDSGALTRFSDADKKKLAGVPTTSQPANARAQGHG